MKTRMVLCVGAAGLILGAGCGDPATRADPVRAAQQRQHPPPAPPARIDGVFHGRWLWRGRPLYKIDHETGRPPVVTPYAEANGHAVIDEVIVDGRKLTFAQIDYIPVKNADATSPPSAQTNEHPSSVVLRVSFTRSNTMLMEKSDADHTLSLLLRRDTHTSAVVPRATLPETP
jgi:hypothetical protein